MNDENWLNGHCKPCEGGALPLSLKKVVENLQSLTSWELEKSPHVSIWRKIKFKNFRQNMAFVGRVAELAEREGHHPDIEIHYNELKLTLWTHAIGGLSENDFILAAKINKLHSS